jgi:hypothetical protein
VPSVPEFVGTPRIEGAEIDCAFGVPPDIESGTLIVYANGAENLFRTEHVQIAIQAERDEGPPIFYGVMAAAGEVLGDDPAERGVTVLAGFNPLASSDEDVEYLYLRDSEPAATASRVCAGLARFLNRLHLLPGRRHDSVFEPNSNHSVPDVGVKHPNETDNLDVEFVRPGAAELYL